MMYMYYIDFYELYLIDEINSYGRPLCVCKEMIIIPIITHALFF